jgi:hypothetical protein
MSAFRAQNGYHDELSGMTGIGAIADRPLYFAVF